MGLSFAVNQEEQIDNKKKLAASNIISEETRRSVGTRPGIIYGLCKFHKVVINNWPPFPPICPQLLLLPINELKF